MAAENALTIIKGMGRLVRNPTDLAAVCPHGGTELGLARNVVFRFGIVTYTIRAEEWGGVAAGVLNCGSRGELTAVLREWNASAIATLFPGYALGASGAATIADDVNAAARAGALVSGAKILVAPYLSDDVQPAILLYNALPRPDRAAALVASRKTEAGPAVAWDAAPDASGRTYATCLLADMAL
jgi:hypothetical protein